MSETAKTDDHWPDRTWILNWPNVMRGYRPDGAQPIPKPSLRRFDSCRGRPKAEVGALHGILKLCSQGPLGNIWGIPLRSGS